MLLLEMLQSGLVDMGPNVLQFSLGPLCEGSHHLLANIGYDAIELWEDYFEIVFIFLQQCL